MSRYFVAALLILWVLAPATALACESCFGAAVESDVTIGIGWAMTMLLILIMVVFGGIVSFFHNMVRRQDMIARGEIVPPFTILPPESAN